MNKEIRCLCCNHKITDLVPPDPFCTDCANALRSFVLENSPIPRRCMNCRKKFTEIGLASLCNTCKYDMEILILQEYNLKGRTLEIKWPD